MSEATSDERLDEWRESLSPVLARFEWQMPAGFPHDFSVASLGEVEEFLLDHYGPGEIPAGDLAESAMAYLGEALLRAGGGGWAWDAERNIPLVRPDDELGRPPISPLALIGDALRIRDGARFAGAYAELLAAVATRPGWTPAKEPTPGVDKVEFTAEPGPWLADWLAKREASFPAWAADAGGGWDFSLASVARLNTLVKRRLPHDEEALTDPAYDDFVQGAAWYAGEAVRRHKRDTEWRYHAPVPGSTDPLESPEHNLLCGRPYIYQGGPDGESYLPLVAIGLAVSDDDIDDWLSLPLDRMP